MFLVKLAAALSVVVGHVASATSKCHEGHNGTFTKELLDDKSICDYKGAQWTGKIPVTRNNSLFYWYYESEVAPEEAPLLVFLAGGPGMSSSANAFVSMGPCRVLDTGNGSSSHEWAWTGFANMLFIDYIAGTGFSKTADTSDVDFPKTYEDMATDIKYFLKTFTKAFPELSGRTLHVGGESFGGAMALAVGYALTDSSTPGPIPDLRLESVVVGSGLIDLEFLYNGRYDVMCAGQTTYLNQTACDTIAAATAACEAAARECRSAGTKEACLDAGMVCSAIDLAYDSTKGGNINVFHLGSTCDYFPTCYEIDEHVETFFNTIRVQEALGFHADGTVKFEVVDLSLSANLSSSGAIYQSKLPELSYLLNNTDVRVLTYTGFLDGQIPGIGNERALGLASWPGVAQYRAQDARPWRYRSNNMWTVGGSIKRFARLTTANFQNAGHFVPIDDPEGIYLLMKDWVSNVSIEESVSIDV